MCLKDFKIKSNIKDYAVCFMSDEKFIADLSTMPNSVFVIDRKVWDLHSKSCLRTIPTEKTIFLDVSEDIKNIETVCFLYEQIMRFTPKKNMTLISIGGGIVQDLTGFVASSLYRGINWIYLPTTLLAQTDSCIGAKTSLNFKQYKNLVGTFFPPTQIYIYPEFLKTLSDADYYSGVGEMAKLSLMLGKAGAEKFISDLDGISTRDNAVVLGLVNYCLAIKKSYIEDDEFDTGKRNMLNYGHCIGHAIESATEFAISHGQAVVLGMILANKEAVRRGVLSKEEETFLRENIFEKIFVVDAPCFEVDKAVSAMGQDKKNTGNGLALVMMTSGYKMCKITDMTIAEAKDLLEKWQK